jgi:hypothetical protein
MYAFCPKHGERLISVGEFTKYWCVIYRCPAQNCPGYIEVADSRWPSTLIQLDIGVLARLEDASPAQLEEAFARIKRIDYKTVSSIFFEHTVLGSYRSRDEYRVIYRDGSDGHFS